MVVWTGVKLLVARSFSVINKGRSDTRSVLPKKDKNFGRFLRWSVKDIKDFKCEPLDERI